MKPTPIDCSQKPESITHAAIIALSQFFAQEYLEGFQATVCPQRVLVRQSKPAAAFVSMTAYSEKHQLFINKLGSVVFADKNNNKSVHASINAYSTVTGQPLAELTGEQVTNLKCAAVTALVTDRCASAGAERLVLYGCGNQAYLQLQAVTAVRPISTVTVIGRHQEKVKQFIQHNQKHYPAIRFHSSQDIANEIAHADIISTATTSADPLMADHLLPTKHIHINCFGNHTCTSREVSHAILAQSCIIVEDKQTAIVEAGHIHQSAIDLKGLMRDQAQELLQQQRTVFSSTGHAMLDLLTIYYLIHKATV